MNSSKNRSSSTKHPWLSFMRKFKEKLEEKCNFMEVRGPASKSHEFSTGSFYEGGCKGRFGMHGYGVYTFPNGVIYEGEFFEGEFHGKGELRYKTSAGKAVIRGLWNKGLMTETTILFDHALEYDAENWQYCKMPDRRFAREYAAGVQPSGNSFMTASQPSVEIPEGYIDTEDGFYHPKKKMIYERYDNTNIFRGATAHVCRTPGRAEQKWILENCRIGKNDMTVGPCQDLCEKYKEPTMLLEPVPPAKYVVTTRKESTFEQYEEDLEDTPAFYDASKCWRDLWAPERKFKPNPIPTVPTGHE